MKKCMKRACACFLLPLLIWGGSLLWERQKLTDDLIRLHVVAASDSDEDQTIKLQVRDAVMKSLKEAMGEMPNAAAARAHLQKNLSQIQSVANEALRAAGRDGEAVVSLCKETFDTRYYDTFALPVGVYEALRITIGEGQGKNWWCVVFPTLCIPATSEGFESVAAGAGFSEKMKDTLTGNYEVHFFLLDVLGQLQNLFYLE